MRLLLLCLLFILPAGSRAQLKVDTQLPMAEMISRLVGPGVKVSNIRVNCPSEKELPYAYFTDNTGTIGIDDGLLMTTGSAANAVGPNNSGARSQANGNQYQDPDLAKLLADGDKQYDACSIEFDVQVFADTLSFDYVFASEEYLEFIREYHDVFGFFIYGPGIPVPRNLALVPGSDLPVSVSNINNSNNADYYLDNGTGETPFDQLFLQYDGFTRKLSARVAVIPCETYSLKFAICDVKDDAYDAGIFIAGKSLRTKAPLLSFSYEYPRFPHAIEGCNGITVKVKRQVKVQEAGRYFLAYEGTAIRNLDYGPVPDSLSFLPGEAEKSFFIPVLKDSIDDDNEFIRVNLLNPCPGLPEAAGIRGEIRESFDFQLDDRIICLGKNIELNPAPAEGYLWSWLPVNGLSCSDCPSPVCSIRRDIMYTCRIEDAASTCRAQDDLKVMVRPAPEALFSAELMPEWSGSDFIFRNQSQNASAWTWDFGDGSASDQFEPAHFFQNSSEKDSVDFSVRLIAGSEASCSDTAIQVVRVPPFYIPNLITPDGDGLNESFQVKGMQSGYWRLEVFNRWGNPVFESDQYPQNWTATGLENGIYFYTLSRKERKYSGWVEIKR